MLQRMPEVQDLAAAHKHVGPIPDPFGSIPGSLRPCEGPTQPSSRSCAYKCRKISSASPRQVTRNRRTTDRRPGEVSTRYRKLVLAEGDDILDLRQAARNSCSTSRR